MEKWNGRVTENTAITGEVKGIVVNFHLINQVCLFRILGKLILWVILIIVGY